MYQSSHFPSSTPLALDLLSDTVLNPLFLPEEIISQREAAAYEVREISNKPEMILPEILHEVAYRDNTLGNPVLCPEDRLHLITSDSLKEYLRTWFRPERMVVAGAGMPHAQLVELVQEHFRDLHSPTIQPPPPSSELPSRSIPSHLLAQPKPSPSLYKSLSTAATSLLSSTAPALDESFEALSAAPARYTGGHKFIYNRESELNHVYLGFEGLSIHDDDIYTLATMQILLGGGGSFSAGKLFASSYARAFKS
jgi:processing peptidase subunit alpha